MTLKHDEIIKVVIMTTGGIILVYGLFYWINHAMK